MDPRRVRSIIISRSAIAFDSFSGQFYDIQENYDIYEDKVERVFLISIHVDNLAIFSPGDAQAESADGRSTCSSGGQGAQ